MAFDGANGWDLTILIVATIIMFLLAMSIGANDVGNNFGTSVGSGVITIPQALIVAAIFEFGGAILLGGGVANTLINGIIKPEMYEDDETAQMYLGMLSAMIGSLVLLVIATAFSLPVSTSHSIVGAILGFTLIAVGWDGVKWKKVGMIAASWVTSPILAGLVGFVLFFLLRTFVLRSKKSYERGLILIPFCYWATFALNLFFILYYEEEDEGYWSPWWGILCLSILIGILVGLIAFFLTPLMEMWVENKMARMALEEEEKRKMVEQSEETTEITDDKSAVQKSATTDEDMGIETIEAPKTLFEKIKQIFKIKEKFNYEKFEERTEQLFTFLQILTACFASFAHGSNDVANSIAPFTVIVSIYQTGIVEDSIKIPWWVLACGGFGIVVGLATFGYRVIKTIGSGLAKVTPTRGFAIEFSGACTVMVGSKIGIPLSTTHCIVGAIMGVGINEGYANVNWGMFVEIFLGWIFTVPIAALVSAGIYSLLFWMLGSHLGLSH